MLNLDFNASQFTKTSLEVSPDVLYDTIIIGGGPAGITSGIYLKRKGRSVAVIAGNIGGQVRDTTSVENYTGLVSITGEKLANEFQNHLSALEVPVKENTNVKSITKRDDHLFLVTTDGDEVFQCKTLLVATGSKPRMLGVPGEEKYSGKGVTYCAICDGPFYEDRDVIVAGGGNSAVEAAIDMSMIAKNVKLVHRSEFRADKILVDKLKGISNVEFYLNTKVLEVVGDDMVTGIRVGDGEKEFTIDAEGIFVEIGYLPNTDLVKGLVDINPQGEIIADKNGHTSHDGLYAAGDVTDVSFKQIIIATGSGASAALAINEYLNKN